MGTPKLIRGGHTSTNDCRRSIVQSTCLADLTTHALAVWKPSTSASASTDPFTHRQARKATRLGDGRSLATLCLSCWRHACDRPARSGHVSFQSGRLHQRDVHLASSPEASLSPAHRLGALCLTLCLRSVLPSPRCRSSESDEQGINRSITNAHCF